MLHKNGDALHDEGQVLTLSNTLEFFGGKRSYCKSYLRAGDGDGYLAWWDLWRQEFENVV
jgi:hypothetical protein